MKAEYLKQHIFLYSFILLQVFVIVASINLNISEEQSGQMPQEEEELKERKYLLSKISFFRLKEGRPYFNLNAENLEMEEYSERSLFLRPQGQVITSQNQVITYAAERGIYEGKKEELNLKDLVSMQTEDSKLTTDTFRYMQKHDKIEARGNVKSRSFSKETKDEIFIDAEELDAYPHLRLSEYRTKVVGRIKRKRAYEENIDFRSARLKLLLNSSKIELNDEVYMKKQQVEATARSGEIYLENYNKKLKYFVLNDDVKVTEKVMLGGESYFRKAFAEKLEGIMSESKIVLTGYPKVYQKKDVIKGNRITLRQNIEVVEVDDASTNFLLKSKEDK
jgi:LPS export ABC transporter protein LptC